MAVINQPLLRNPILQRMPKSQRDWIQYTNELAKWVIHVVDTANITENAVSEVYSATDAGPLTQNLASPSLAKSWMILDVTVEKENDSDIIEVSSSFNVDVSGGVIDLVATGAFRTSSTLGSDFQDSTRITGASNENVAVVGTFTGDAAGTHDYGLGLSIILSGGGADDVTVEFRDVNVRVAVIKR